MLVVSVVRGRACWDGLVFGLFFMVHHHGPHFSSYLALSKIQVFASCFGGSWGTMKDAIFFMDLNYNIHNDHVLH